MWFLERVLYHLIVSHFWLLDSKISLCLSLSRTQTHTLTHTHTHTLSLFYYIFAVELWCPVKIVDWKDVKTFWNFRKGQECFIEKITSKTATNVRAIGRTPFCWKTLFRKFQSICDLPRKLMQKWLRKHPKASYMIWEF